MSLKILVYETEPVITDALKPLEADHEVCYTDRLLSKANVADFDDADIITTDQSVLDEDLLRQFKKLRLIAVRSTGVDHIDTACCKRLGIQVANVPAYAANAVAEHTFALLLALSRHIEASQAFTRKTRFLWDGLQGFELQGKTLSVIGTGAIGKRVAEIGRGFGMEVMLCDLYPDHTWAENRGMAYVDFEAAVCRADVLSLNVPLVSKDRYLIGTPEFQKMKEGVVLLNTARGEVVDPEALFLALDSGKVASAGLDVLQDEHYIREKERTPEIYFKGQFDSNKMLANHLLCQHPNVLVTPHVGWYTFEAEKRALDTTRENINGFILGKSQNIVNP